MTRLLRSSQMNPRTGAWSVHGLTRLLVVGVMASSVPVACEDKAEQAADRWTDGSMPSNMPVPLPWFTEEQVAVGEQLYMSNCAECHGQYAEGAEEWKAMGPDGKRRPPPLNGTAHAWHHPVADLRAVFMANNHGSEDGEPSRQDELTGEDALAIIAWLQSLWPDETYAKWHYSHHRDEWH